MDTFEFVPDYSSSVDIEPEVKSISFGDGYSQRVSKIVNNAPEKWNLSFNRSQTDIDVIKEWLKAKKGSEAFLYTTPLGDTIQFLCREWSEAKDGYNNITLSATFEEKV